LGGVIDPAKVAFWVPPELKKFKLDLFNRIGAHIQSRGGRVIRGDVAAMAALPMRSSRLAVARRC